jgi:hypothetical protein
MVFMFCCGNEVSVESHRRGNVFFWTDSEGGASLLQCSQPNSGAVP